MTNAEREDWQKARVVLVNELRRTEQRLIEYPADENDDDFHFLIRKASTLRDWIVRIDHLLEDELNEPN